jgi:isopenicillin N synthase-like dioxygenase
MMLVTTILINGRYRSTVHRVMLDPAGKSQRHSVAFFANPTFHTPVSCFPSCCAPTSGMPPARFEPITAGKYIFGRLGLMYEDGE